VTLGGESVSKRIAVLAAVVAAALVGLPAQAASGDAPWTVNSGKTIGDGETAIWGQAGFPGVSAELVHGIDPLTEIGGKFAFDYGQQGVINSCCVVGLDFQFLLRRTFYSNNTFYIAGTFQPGFLLEFPTGTTQFGLAFPLGVQFGFPVNSQLTFNASFDLAMYALFGSGGRSGTFALPILFGGGVEYLMQKNLALTFELKLGPTIFTAGGSAQFTLYALVGIAYKF
jgi:hypothetical protein